VALLGSSGVGKSTLANSLGAGSLATGEIRDKDGRGRHTTTSRSLHLLPSGGVLVDNPGIRELQLPACEDGLLDVFEDVVRIAALCRFSNCNHDGDAGCAVMAAIESGELDQRRFANFQKLSAEQAHNSRSLAERRERDRKMGRIGKSILESKRRVREEK
jgi:ribosome biogenesis GTPase